MCVCVFENGGIKVKAEVDETSSKRTRERKNFISRYLFWAGRRVGSKSIRSDIRSAQTINWRAAARRKCGNAQIEGVYWPRPMGMESIIRCGGVQSVAA